MKKLVSFVAAAFAVLACSSPKEAFPVYMSFRPGEDLEEVSENFRFMKEKGVTGVCVHLTSRADDLAFMEEVASRAHAEGLEYHALVLCNLRDGLPHEWYTVNRLGQSSDEFPPYTPRYKFIDPHNPEVRSYLVRELGKIADVPSVDYIELDFIRYPDVILPKGYESIFNWVVDGEEPIADCCYCDACTSDFKEKTGIDILAVEDPSTCLEWAQFRCDAVTGLVNELAAALHAKGKKVSAAVFPGPASFAIPAERQDWGKWDVDLFFAMNYNALHCQSVGWIKDVTVEELEASGGKPVVSLLFVCKDWQERDKAATAMRSGLTPAELSEAVKDAMEVKASGVGVYTYSRMAPEHWEALQSALEQ